MIRLRRLQERAHLRRQNQASGRKINNPKRFSCWRKNQTLEQGPGFQIKIRVKE
jgi:hypothetical protein